MSELVRAGTVDEIKAAGHRVVPVGNVTVLVMFHEGEFHAVDNRCPHMGFPLHRGDIQAGLLDCHWHHARFDITSGATLDPWADDVDCYRVYVEAGAVFVDPNRPARDPRAHGLQRLERGLNENIRLVVAKSAVELEAGGVPASEAVAIGARFGAKEHEQGWRSGLTILSAMANVLDDLAPEDRARGLTKSLAWIATECEGQPPRRPLPGLHETRRDLPACGPGCARPSRYATQTAPSAFCARLPRITDRARLWMLSLPAAPITATATAATPSTLP